MMDNDGECPCPFHHVGTQQKDGIYESGRGHSPALSSAGGFVLDPSLQNGEKYNLVADKPPSLWYFVVAA